MATIFESSSQLNRPYFYDRGRDYIVSGQYREAIESLNLLLRSQPEEAEGYFLRGVAKYNLGDLHGANRDFSLAIEYNTVYTLAYQYRAITRSRLGQYSEALQDFERAIEMRPTFSGAYYSRAVTNFLNRQFQSAIEDYDEFIRLEPLSADGYVNRGTAKLYLKDSTAAMEDYNTAIRVNPYLSDGFLRRGALYMSKGDIDLAIGDMNAALELDSTIAIGYFYRAMAHNFKGNIDLSLSDFGSSIHYDPTNSVAIFNRAILRSQIGDYNRAIEDYTLVSQQNPNNVLVYYNRAAVYAQVGELTKAIEDYTKAIEIYGDFANAYLYRSQLKAMLRDRRGYNEDRQKAEELMVKYRTELNKNGHSAFADTSSRYSDIISFNADFEDSNLSRIKSKTLSKYEPLPLYNYELMSRIDSVIGVDHRRFNSAKVSEIETSMAIPLMRLQNGNSDLAGWQFFELDGKLEEAESYSELFKQALVASGMNEYSRAIDLYSFLITDSPDNPLPYLNRAVAEAEMASFMVSVEGEYQSLASQGNPVERLHNSQGKTTINYNKIIADLESAARLLPELPHIFYNLGYIYAEMGDIPRAIENYSRAIEIFPYFAEAYYNRGLLQLSLDELEKGALDLSRAGEIGIEKAYTIITSITK